MKLLITYLGRDDGDEKSWLQHEEVQDLADTYMGEDATIGEIFKASQKEHGRCISKVYLDTKSRGVISVGWVFEKRMQYEDSKQTYMQEVWVSLLDRDETVRYRDYHEIGKATVAA